MTGHQTEHTRPAVVELLRARALIETAGKSAPPPRAYRIVHVFQRETDEDTPESVYSHTVDMADWTAIAPTIDRMTSEPDGSGHTVSITVCQIAA